MAIMARSWALLLGLLLLAAQRVALVATHRLPRAASCDVIAGEWVPTDARPYYNPAACAARVSPQDKQEFGCANRTHGARYARWRWQPASCSLPAATHELLARALGGKRLLFVGDSLVRNMYESLVCLLLERYGKKAVRLGKWGAGVDAGQQQQQQAEEGGQHGVAEEAACSVSGLDGDADSDVLGDTGGDHYSAAEAAAEAAAAVPQLHRSGEIGAVGPAANPAATQHASGSLVQQPLQQHQQPHQTSHSQAARGQQHYWVVWRDKQLAHDATSTHMDLSAAADASGDADAGDDKVGSGAATLASSPRGGGGSRGGPLDVGFFPSPYLVLPQGAMDQVDPLWIQQLRPAAADPDDAIDAAATAAAAGGGLGLDLGLPPVDVLVISVGHWLRKGTLLTYNNTRKLKRRQQQLQEQGQQRQRKQHDAQFEVPMVSVKNAAAALRAIVAAVHKALRQASFTGRVFWLGYPPPHAGCERSASPVVGSAKQGEGGTQWTTAMIHKAEVEAVAGTGWQLLDVTVLSGLRPDAHLADSFNCRKPAAEPDCMHWCLGGVPDTWVELLLMHLVG